MGHTYWALSVYRQRTSETNLCRMGRPSFMAECPILRPEWAFAKRIKKHQCISDFLWVSDLYASIVEDAHQVGIKNSRGPEM